MRVATAACVANGAVAKKISAKARVAKRRNGSSGEDKAKAAKKIERRKWRHRSGNESVAGSVARRQ